MAYWLVKSEPSVYSFDQLLKEKKTMWDGVRNYGARNNLRDMKKGDKLLYYHSNEGVAIVGIAEVVKEHYPDPTTDADAWVVVDIKPVKKLKQPVTLAQVKAEASLADMDLVRLGRLSVQRVKAEEWAQVMKMAAEKS